MSIHKQPNTNLCIADFNSVNNFWAFITKQDTWYVTYTPEMVKDINAYIPTLWQLILNSTNALRKSMTFASNHYEYIHVWDTLVFKAHTNASNTFNQEVLQQFKQYCHHCKTQIPYEPRYPKSICIDCTKLITNIKGEKVTYFNEHYLGFGCQGFYVGANNKKYNSDVCFINNTPYVAQEAKFGGIVIRFRELPDY